MSMWICSLGHELCHPMRMSASPGQGLGWVWGFFFCLLVCPQIRSDKDWLLCLLSREDKKADLRQEGRLCLVEEARPGCPSVAPMASTEKPVSPPAPNPTGKKRMVGFWRAGTWGLWETDSRFSTRAAGVRKPSQVRRGVGDGRKIIWAGCCLPQI